jgi:uncharacterized membrane protein YczE
VAWICFAVGLIVLLVGVFIGLKTSLRAAPGTATDKLNEARDKIDTTKRQMQAALSGQEAATAEAATQSADEAKSALEQFQGIIASLPENLRFSAMLVLVGTALMSVATVQFGGVSLF